MRDGHSLPISRYPSAMRVSPAVLLFTPYRKESWWLTYYVSSTYEGYDVILADVRGLGGSTGAYLGPFSREKIDDAVALLELVADPDSATGTSG